MFHPYCTPENTHAHAHTQREHTACRCIGGCWCHLGRCVGGGWCSVGIQQRLDPVRGSLLEISQQQGRISPHQAQRAHFFYLLLGLRLITWRRRRQQRRWQSSNDRKHMIQGRKITFQGDSMLLPNYWQQFIDSDIGREEKKKKGEKRVLNKSRGSTGHAICQHFTLFSASYSCVQFATALKF